MRLKILEHGHSPVQKVFLGIIRLLVGRVPGPILTFSYRKPFFGKPFSVLCQQILRGPSEWSVGERELFAAYISKLNQCPY